MTDTEDQGSRDATCRECRAGAAQVVAMEPAWLCMEHGIVRLSEYQARDSLRSAGERGRYTELVEAARAHCIDAAWHSSHIMLVSRLNDALDEFANAIRGESQAEVGRLRELVAAAQALVDLAARWNSTDWDNESEYRHAEAECYRVLADRLEELRGVVG
ncbi:MAG: hypothetical protein NUW01_08870 [Gemmatimonadaceae bacterium]|nr:hypothetical protein [Gemmatimonadaceae bacterium]